MLLATSALLPQTSYAIQSQINLETVKKPVFAWSIKGQQLDITIEGLHDFSEQTRFYDEKLIRRISTSAIQGRQTRVLISLRNLQTKVHVEEYQDPYRIVVFLIDADSAEESDDQINADINVATSPETLSLVKSAAQNVSNTLRESVGQIAEGRGNSWHGSPSFIYPDLLPAALNNTKGTKNKIDHIEKENLAQYASDLFDLGQEKRARSVYEQVLKLQPTIFNENSTHLWKFAETHFGEGNLDLARGYYNAVIERSPSSSLADYAKLRVADILYLKSDQSLESYWKSLELPRAKNDAELQALVKIRTAFFSQKDSKNQAKGYLPTVLAEDRKSYLELVPALTGQITTFLIYSLYLNAQVEEAMTIDQQRELEDYANAFEGFDLDNIKENLISENLQRLKISMIEDLTNRRFQEVIQRFESAKVLKKTMLIDKDFTWMIGLSYVMLGQTSKAVPFFENTIKVDEDNTKKWIANLYLCLEKKGDANDLDKSLDRFWSSLDSVQQSDILLRYKDTLERFVDEQRPYVTPKRILLAGWKKSFSEKDSGIDSVFPNDHRAIASLSKLSDVFRKQGLASERKDVLSLLAGFGPEAVRKSQEINKVWVDVMTEYAEDYRRENNYLEAGKVYAQIGAGANEKNASHLYRGGLLLFRSGRRDEAVAAFRLCSQDTRDRFYANLCLERLEKLEI